MKFHNCILPRKLYIFKQIQNNKGKSEIEIKGYFLMDFIKTTIFFNGVIERAANKEFEYIFNN